MISTLGETSSHETEEQLEKVPQEPVSNPVDNKSIDRKFLVQGESLFSAYTEEVREELIYLKEIPSFKVDATRVTQTLDQLSSTDFSSISKEDIDLFSEGMKEARELIRQHRSYIDDYFYRLNLAFESKNINLFERYLKDVASLAAGDKRTDYWKRLSEKVPRYFELSKSALRHKVEGDLKTELKILIETKALGFVNDNLESRIKELRVAIADSDFLEAMSNAMKQLEDHEPKAALAHVKTALLIYPSDLEALTLNDRIENDIRTIRLNSLVNQGRDLAEEDNWKKSGEMYASALLIAPENLDAKRGIEKARLVMSYKRIYADFVNRPERLTDKEVRLFANETLLKTEQLSYESPSIAVLAEKTRKILEEISPVKIRIRSDGISRIRVSGVGYIEPTIDRYVELLPGTYNFFAECSGKRTRLYEVKIPIIGPPLEFRIECGESI
ncbi:hypothetical protein OAL10_10915 [Gammaproteobacteria bacterium]|nr:hypothetical protein [Gammaproteobacteria bacterium]